MALDTLPSVYRDFSESEFSAELKRVESATEVERQWIEDAGLTTYRNDEQIMEGVEAGKLERVLGSRAFDLIERLKLWGDERSDPNHEFHYSPPFLRPRALNLLEHITIEWQQEAGDNSKLSVTSLIRSDEYQDRLRTRDKKLTIASEGLISSHQAGIAFDIDGCGLIIKDEEGKWVPMNPRTEQYDFSRAQDSAELLEEVLKCINSERRRISS